jgi:Acetyltransferase (isoleucine patch superfamily)
MIIQRVVSKIKRAVIRKKFRGASADAVIPSDIVVSVRDNLIMKEGSSLEIGTIILNVNAKFVLGRFSGAGPGLTVVTGNHMSIIGKYQLGITEEEKSLNDINQHYDQDIVVEDDVWIGANVTLLSGVRVGRGAIIAAGAICRTAIPPYSIVMGNPAKVVGFRYTPAQVEEHELLLYKEAERLPMTLIEKNYKRYYLDRLKDINQYCRI